MKINSNRLFPYPVLKEDNGNFISSKLNVKVEYRHNEIEYEFVLDVNLDEKNLISLIKKEDVSIVCHLECAKTKFRSIEELKLGKNEFKINVDSLDGKLELVVFIIAKKDLNEYSSDDFHSDYQKNSFFIQSGNILGIAEIPSVFIENKKENYSNIPSIFDIAIASPFEKIMKLVLNGDRIKILLPVEEFKIRNSHKNSLHSRNIMNAMIVLPALVGVLNALADKESVEMFANRRWFGVINKKLKGLGVEIENGDLENELIFNIAQQLLEELFLDAMESLNYLEETEE